MLTNVSCWKKSQGGSIYNIKFSANDFKFGLGCRAAASLYNNDGHCFIWLKKLTVRGKTIKSQYMFWLIQLWKESLNSDDE